MNTLEKSERIRALCTEIIDKRMERNQLDVEIRSLECELDDVVGAEVLTKRLIERTLDLAFPSHVGAPEIDE